MSRPARSNLATVAVLALAAGCSAAGAAPVTLSPSGDVPDVAQVTAAEASALPAVVAAANATGAHLAAAADPSTNVVVSPLSLTLALGMLAEGASGDGLGELDALLGASGQERTEAMNALLTALGTYEADPADFDTDAPPASPVLHVANRVVVDEGFPVLNDYLVRLHQWFDAGAGQTDLATDAGKKYLDAWVNAETAGLIPESAIQPDEYLSVVLQSALLFGASWALPFNPDSTGPADFTTPSGVVQADAMTAKMWVRYAYDGDWAAIRLDYTSGFYSTVILPPVGVDPAEMSDDVRDRLLSVLASTTTNEVIIQLPKFDLTASLQLMEQLQALGLSAIFTDGSLTGITTEPLWVSQAVQQCVLRVSEAGTIGAAVTELGMDTTSAPAEPPPAFIVDRPFWFLVTNADTGIDVFAAAIRDPLG